MKKMYNNPKTEAVELFSSNLMLDASIGSQDQNPGGVISAPARKAANPLQGQIKM